MRLFNFRFIASVRSEFILWNLEVFDKRCVSCWMYSFLFIITNMLFLSAFRMRMFSFLLNSLILLSSSFVIRSLVKSLLSFRPNLFNSYANLSSFLMVTFFLFFRSLDVVEKFFYFYLGFVIFKFRFEMAIHSERKYSIYCWVYFFFCQVDIRVFILFVEQCSSVLPYSWLSFRSCMEIMIFLGFI